MNWIETADECRRQLYHTRSVQGLRQKYQLGFCDFVYPYTYEGFEEFRNIPFNYPAYEHAYNCYITFKEWLIDRFGKTLKDKRLLGLLFAFYLHDVGKGTAGHILDNLRGYEHREYGRKIILSDEISSILEQYGLNPEEIGEMVLEQMPPYGDFLDQFERFIYVHKDKQKEWEATNLPLIGEIWTRFKKLSRCFNLSKKEFYLEDLYGDLKKLFEFFLFDRAQLTVSVYGHPANRSASNMYRRCVEAALGEEAMTMDDILNFTLLQQYERFDKIKDEKIKKISENLQEGVPFYGIRVRPNKKELNTIQKMKQDEKKRLAIESNISRRIKSVALVDINPLPEKVDLNFRIKRAGKFYEAREIIDNRLEENLMEEAHSIFYVFVAPDARKKYDPKTLRNVVLSVCGFEKK